MRRPTNNARALFVLSGAVAQVVLGALPFILGWDSTIAARSQDAQTLLTPAGYAFSIWSVLFAGCAIYAVVHLFRRASPSMRRTGWFAGAAFWLNGAWETWVPAFGIEAVSLVIILGCWVACLAFILIESGARETSVFDRAVRLPLFALGGWLNAAAAVNLLAVLEVYDVPFLGSGADPAALVVLSGALLAAGAVIVRTGSVSYALAVGWALAGIVSALMSNYTPTMIDSVAFYAAVFALPALVLLGWAGLLRAHLKGQRAAPQAP
jgi:hypothetical protein